MSIECLLTGGSGLLGTELQKLMEVDAPSHEEFDVLDRHFPHECDMVIHAAGYTDVAKAEIERRKCFEANVVGTCNFAMDYPERFVFISSEYARNPVNYYSETKRAAELAVEAYADTYLIIRTLFKPRPYPWDKAFEDQYTQGDYVDVIAPLIAREIYEWDGESRTVYVGTGRKTMLELARRTRPDVQPNSIKDIKNVTLPADYE